jgi:hypothetical protein
MLDADELEDYLESRDANVRAAIRQSNVDIKAGRVPAEVLVKPAKLAGCESRDVGNSMASPYAICATCVLCDKQSGPPPTANLLFNHDLNIVPEQHEESNQPVEGEA